MVIYANLNQLARKLKLKDATVYYKDFGNIGNKNEIEVAYFGGEKIPNSKKLLADRAIIAIRDEVIVSIEGDKYCKDGTIKLTKKERKILKLFGLEEGNR